MFGVWRMIMKKYIIILLITTVGKCGKKSSLDAILHRQLSRIWTDLQIVVNG